MPRAPTPKGVACPFRYRDVSRSDNSRYLDGLAVISDPTATVREGDRLAGSIHWKATGPEERRRGAASSRRPECARR